MIRSLLCLLCLLAAVSPETHGHADTQTTLAELKKLAEIPDDESVKKLSPDEALDLLKNRAHRALQLLKTYEATSPSAADLLTAQTAALTAIGHAEEELLHETGSALAKRILDGAAKGSDHGAHADLYLLGRAYHRIMKDVKSPDDLRKVYDRNATRMREAITRYLEVYPKYRPAADAFRIVVRLAESHDDQVTQDVVVRAVARNFPDHQLARILRRQEAVGKELNFSFTPRGSDRPSSLKERRGKVVLVNFWASWCIPCRAEATRLRELHERYHKEGLEIVGINVDEKDETVARFLRENKIAWPQVSGDAARKFAAEWGIETLPHQFLVDRQGKLRSTDAIGKLADLLPELLAEKK